MAGGKGNIRPSDNPKPFQKGNNANPKGYPKGLENSSTRLKRLLGIIQKRVNPATGEEEDFSILEQMDAAIIMKALAGDIKAYEQILDRFEGKSKSQTEERSDEITVNVPNE